MNESTGLVSGLSGHAGAHPPQARVFRRHFLFLCAAIVASIVGVEILRSSHIESTRLIALSTRAAAKSRPHILFVLVDDLGSNDIGYRSSEFKGITPVLDGLATDGIRLSRYYSMHMCTPARAALLTSMYPSRIGMQFETVKPDSPWGLPLDQTTMTEYLKGRGYTTHGVGKWNQGHFSHEYLPTARGFNTFYGYLTDEIHYYTHEYPEEFCFDIVGDLLTSETTCTYFTDFMDMDASTGYQTVDANATYSSSLFTERAVDIIEDFNASAGSALFLYYAAQNVHGPLDAPPTSLLSSVQMARIDAISDSNRRTFAGMAAALDQSVGRIVDSLKQTGLWNDTLLVFASDNGGCSRQGGSNLPLRGGKHFLFDGGLRVPSFVSSPLLPRTVHGTTFGGLFHVTDWLPTLLSAVDIDQSIVTGTVDGMDQWSALLGEANPPRGEALLGLNSFTVCCLDYNQEETCEGFLSDCANVYLASMARKNNTRAALISGSWKIIINEYGLPWYGLNSTSDEHRTLFAGKDDDAAMSNCGSNPGSGLDNFLFNIQEDPNETTNLYSERPDVVNKVTAAWFPIPSNSCASCSHHDPWTSRR